MINSTFVVLHRQVGRLAPKHMAGMNDDLEPQLDRLGIRFVGSNVHRMFQRGHENLAVPDLSGANGVLDHSHRLFDQVAGERDLQADSGQEIQDRFGSREELGTPWSTEALDFRDGYSSDVKRRQGPADLVNLEVLDKRGDNFHCWHPPLAGIPGPQELEDQVSAGTVQSGGALPLSLPQGRR
jgi:hypothetical protein